MERIWTLIWLPQRIKLCGSKILVHGIPQSILLCTGVQLRMYPFVHTSVGLSTKILYYVATLMRIRLDPND